MMDISKRFEYSLSLSHISTAHWRCCCCDAHNTVRSIVSVGQEPKRNSMKKTSQPAIPFRKT
jgi:hypothetical protein